ncbi:promotilin isoform X2 [Lithobates pipiens]
MGALTEEERVVGTQEQEDRGHYVKPLHRAAMVFRAVLSILLITYGLCMLAERTQGSFLHFFSHSDACNMQKGGPCKKFLQQRSEGGDLRSVGDLEEEDVIKAPAELELRLDSQQIDNYRTFVEELFGGEAQKS